LISYVNVGDLSVNIDKVKLRSYVTWSLLDVFEWSDGYDVCFGLVQGGLPVAEAFRMIFERIYECGYNECRRELDRLQTQKLLNREQIITEMCYTMHHDYGIIKDTETGRKKGQFYDHLSSGMTVADREFLWKQMAQLYDNCIVRHLK
jgi:hypothetical protein